MRAVVTGGAGFIGSHLIESLLVAGDSVVCVERPHASLRWIAGLQLSTVLSGVHDPVELARAFDGADVVYHLAGLTEARSPADFYAVNTEGTGAVLRAAAAQGSRAPRVILMSSIAAVGPCRDGQALGPDTIPHPISTYGQSKLLAEAAVHAFRDRVPATILRLPSVYGPRERGVLKFFQLVTRGWALTIGGWDRELSLIYVKDVAAALRHVAATPAAARRTYYLAHPEIVTWRGFAATVGAALARDPRLISVPAPLAQVIAMGAELGAALQRKAAVLNRERVAEITQSRWVCDASATYEELGFMPAYPTSVGVPETATWYREAGWI